MCSVEIWYLFILIGNCISFSMFRICCQPQPWIPEMFFVIVWVATSRKSYNNPMLEGHFLSNLGNWLFAAGLLSLSSFIQQGHLKTGTKNIIKNTWLEQSLHFNIIEHLCIKVWNHFHPPSSLKTTKITVSHFLKFHDSISAMAMILFLWH